MAFAEFEQFYSYEFHILTCKKITFFIFWRRLQDKNRNILHFIDFNIQKCFNLFSKMPLLVILCYLFISFHFCYYIWHLQLFNFSLIYSTFVFFLNCFLVITKLSFCYVRTSSSLMKKTSYFKNLWITSLYNWNWRIQSENTSK